MSEENSATRYVKHDSNFVANKKYLYGLVALVISEPFCNIKMNFARVRDVIVFRGIRMRQGLFVVSTNDCHGIFVSCKLSLHSLKPGDASLMAGNLTFKTPVICSSIKLLHSAVLTFPLNLNEVSYKTIKGKFTNSQPALNTSQWFRIGISMRHSDQGHGFCTLQG